MSDEQTLKWYCARDGVVLRTAQYHRQILGVGRLVGSTYILTDDEWLQIRISIDTARRGNPNWKKR